MKEKNKIGELYDFINENKIKIIFYAMIFLAVSLIVIEKLNVDYFSKKILEDNYPEALIFLLGSAAVACIMLYKLGITRIWLHFKSEKLNNIDIAFVITDVVLISLLWKYQTIKFPCLIRVYVCIHIARILIFFFSKDERNYNTVWLSDVYNNRIKRNQYKSIMIKGDESKVDLLDKSKEIESIATTILNCNPENAFFIGIDGEWGKGKTTLINFVIENVKKESDEFVIVKFDPCRYKDCEAMLTGFYNEIAKEISIYDSLKYKNALKSLIKDIFKEVSSKFSIPNVTLILSNDSNINDIICKELEIQNRKLIIVIDNLDRADRELISFFIRCMYSVTEFKRTVFLILHDADLLNHHLSGIYGKEKLFMNKIINLPINIADNDKRKIASIWYKSAQNLKENGYIDFDELEKIDFYEDLRDVVRSLNCLIHKADVLKELQLNYYDYFGLMYIKEYDYKLYTNIRNNYGILTYKSKFNGFNQRQKEQDEGIKNQIKELYEKIDNNNCKNIIKKMFNNVDSVIALDILPGRENDDDKNNIESEKYFFMYFLVEESEYSLCKKKVNAMLDRIHNNINDINIYIEEIMTNIVEEDNPTISSFCSDLIKKDVEKHGKEHYNLALFSDAIRYIINNYKNKPFIIAHINDILLALLNQMNEEEFTYEIDNMSKEYNNLWIYNQLHAYQLDRDKNDKIENMKTKMCEEIKANKDQINIMEGDFYGANLYVLHEHFGKKTVDEMMLNWVNEKTIFRYIRQGIVSLHGDGIYKYTYHPINSYEDQIINCFMKNIDESKLDANEKNILYVYNHRGKTVETPDKREILF